MMMMVIIIKWMERRERKKHAIENEKKYKYDNCRL